MVLLDYPDFAFFFSLRNLSWIARISYFNVDGLGFVRPNKIDESVKG